MSSYNLSDEIIGKWATSGVTMEFLGNGTMRATSEGKTEVWAYTLYDNHTIQIGISGRPKTWQSYEIEITGSSLTLTLQNIGIPIVYKRL